MKHEKGLWHQLAELCLFEWDVSDGDCDAITSAVSIHLKRKNISHTCFKGVVREPATRSIVVPHYWVELKDGFFIDLRVRKFMGEEERIPHGIFHPSWYPEYCYSGEPVEDIGWSYEILDTLCEWTIEKLELPDGCF